MADTDALLEELTLMWACAVRDRNWHAALQVVMAKAKLLGIIPGKNGKGDLKKVLKLVDYHEAPSVEEWLKSAKH